MTTMDLRKMFNASYMTPRTINEIRKLTQYNMFNTMTSMWADDDGFVLHFDSIRTEWTETEWSV